MPAALQTPMILAALGIVPPMPFLHPGSTLPQPPAHETLAEVSQTPLTSILQGSFPPAANPTVYAHQDPLTSTLLPSLGIAAAFQPPAFTGNLLAAAQ